MNEPEVSGRAFLGIIAHVRAERGADYLAEIVARAGAATRRALSTRIRVFDWHPYEAYVGFLRVLAREMGADAPDFPRRLGEIAGRRDLGSILRVYVALSSPERLIRSSAKIWPSYYRNAGRMEAVTWSPEDTTLRIHDFPSMSHHHCRLMEGWMISTMQTIGFQPSEDARETRCPSRGDAWHEFSCRWTRRA